MKHYVALKKIILPPGDSTIGKDTTITAEDVGQANIDRYLKKGYIKPLGKDSAKPAPGAVKRAELPFYMTADDFLSPEQIDKLTKAQLVEYAGRIGVAGFKPNISAADLKNLLNQFIDEASEEDACEDEEDEEEEGADDNERSME